MRVSLKSGGLINQFCLPPCVGGR